MDCVKADPPRSTPGASLSSHTQPHTTSKGQGRLGATGGAGHGANEGRAGWKSRDGSNCSAEQQPQPSQAAASWFRPGEPPLVQQESAQCLLLHPILHLPSSKNVQQGVPQYISLC